MTMIRSICIVTCNERFIEFTHMHLIEKNLSFLQNCKLVEESAREENEKKTKEGRQESERERERKLMLYNNAFSA
jgi:hypothetical protein